jgi:hypothetical protein
VGRDIHAHRDWHSTIQADPPSASDAATCQLTSRLRLCVSRHAGRVLEALLVGAKVGAGT